MVALGKQEGGVLMAREEGEEVRAAEAQQEGEGFVCEGGRRWWSDDWGWENGGCPFGKDVDDLVSRHADVGFNPMELDG